MPDLKIDPIPDMLMELSVTEMAVPCQMMWMTAQPLPVGGYVLRKDVVDNLNRAAMAALTPLSHDLMAVKRVAVRVERTSNTILRGTNAASPLHAFYVTCRFVLLLVDEGLLADAQSMGVLVALACINDLKEFGGVDGFTFKDRILEMEAKTMLDAARKEGLYRDQKTIALQSPAAPS